MIDKYIRDNVHGDIHIKHEVVKEIIDSPEFQRLRRITQLGGGQFVFPGANHTRFSHCIGVYHIVGKILANEKVAAHFTDEEKLIVQLSGLLHDIGHGPFSHSFEALSKRNHEEYTVDFILHETNINRILKKHQISPEEVASVIQGKHPNKILNLLISSQIDADRLDYLLRDSRSTGVDYANLDLDWIIRNAEVVDNKLVFKIKTLNAIEHYLLGRYHMFTQIYNHKTSVAFDQTYKAWFQRLKDLYQEKNYQFQNKRMLEVLQDFLNDKPCNLERYLVLDDYTMIDFIKTCTTETDAILQDLATRIINRRFLGVSKYISQKNEKV
ncbi:HD superfamily phosphohydrolase [Spiroplasma clarkii]|uniref:HD domain-containing protein n=1 Tax=Spiroplasma clarkii TaxID=2139 RepID=UPI000B565BF2|nr:HD domain-containing protein [Spiroplasma clarkii]ARU90867.1 HD superfamily phosphohydrolase [Spiroplasma clarkii]